MSSQPDIENLSNDNGRSYFRAQRFRSKGKTVLTPTRALEPRRAVLLPSYDTSEYSVVELFGEFDGEDIAGFQDERSRVDDLESRLRRQNRLGPESASRICFAQFKPRSTRDWPSSEELSFLTDLTHSYSDIVPVPSIARAIGLIDLDRLFDHVNQSIRMIERLNNKPLMGWIPVAMPRTSYGKLLDNYLKHGVRTFCVDFAGRIPTHLQLRPILALLAERKALESSVLYGLNARPGKFVKNAKEIPSRDFFAYGYGLDILGGSHLRAFVPPEIGKKSTLNGAIAMRLRNKKRVFVKKTYGYHRLDSLSDAEELLPKNCPIPPKTLVESTNRSIEKAFSMDQQHAEAGELHNRLVQLGSRESVLNYVSAKRLAAEAVPNFRRARTLF